MQRSCFGTISRLSVLLASACGGPEIPTEEEITQANIRDGTPAKEYPATCLVDMFNEKDVAVGLCTGTLVAPSVILTAGHCVDGIHHFRVDCPYLKQTAAGKGEPHPKYRPGVRGSIAPDSPDIGLIYLTSRIPFLRYPTINSSKLPIGTQVVNVGRVKDKVPSRTELYRGSVVKLQDGRAKSFPLAYLTEDRIQQGDSGGPTYLVRLAGREQEVAAVNSGVVEGQYQVLARTDLVFDWISARVSQHGGWNLPDGYQPLVNRRALDVQAHASHSR